MTDTPDQSDTGAGELLDQVNAHTYVSLTTYRKNGTPVSTPVWIAREGDRLVVISVDNAGKVKRLARDPRVELRPCDVRGRVADDAPTWTGSASVARDGSSVKEVKRAISQKYVLARLGNGMERVAGRLMRRAPRAGIFITLD